MAARAAVERQGPDPDGVPEHDLFRQRRLRHPAGRPDLLRSRRVGARPRRGGAARGDPGRPFALRPASRTRGTRGAARTSCCATMVRAGEDQPPRPARHAAAPLPRREDVRPPAVETIVAPYFANYVKEELIDRFGARCVYGGGLRVTTTIDLELQRIARRSDREVARRRARADGRARRARSARRRRSWRWSAAATSARASSTSPCRGSASRARRSSRSCSRPRSRTGIAPASTFVSRPKRDLARRQALVGRATTRTRTSGAVTLAEATTHSDNAVYAQLTQLVGPKAVATTARNGSGSAAARPVLRDRARRRGGQPARARPRLRGVRDRRRPARQRRSSATGRASPVASRGAASPRARRNRFVPRRVLRRATATSINQMLQDVVRRGTGRRAALADRPSPARPARRRTTATRGSSATRRSS